MTTLVKLILLYAGFLQIQLPWQSSIKFKELTELSCDLEIVLKDDRWIRYDDFLMGFYDAVSLPSLKEVFLYEQGDGHNPLNPTIWYTHHGKNVRGWIDILQQQRRDLMFTGPRDRVSELDEFLKDLEYVHSIYDKLDDACRVTMKPITRRKAIKFVQDRIGIKDWDKMKLPRPEEYLFWQWNVKP